MRIIFRKEEKTVKNSVGIIKVATSDKQIHQTYVTKIVKNEI